MISRYSKAIAAFIGSVLVVAPVIVADIDKAWAAVAPVLALIVTYLAPKNTNA